MGDQSQRINVFISYSHQDAAWLQRLRVHLRPLERENRLEIWDDTKIKPGSNWMEEIRQALAATKVAVLLVSADFLASDFIVSDELPALLRAAEEDGASILPVILSPSRFEKTPNLAEFQAVNNPSRPLIGLRRNEQEAVLVKVSEVIEALLNHSPETVMEHEQKEVTVRVGEPRRLKRGDTDEPPKAETRTPGEMSHTKSPKLHPKIWVAIIAGIVALVTAYWQFVYKPGPVDDTVRYTGRVTDQTSQRAIRGAKVSVEARGIPQVYYTDSDGIFNLQLRSSDEAIRIRVEADGYETFDRNVSLSRNVIEDVRLMPVNISSQPSPTVTPGIYMNKTENKSSAVTNSTTRRTNGVNNASNLAERKRQALKDLGSTTPQP